MANGFKLTFGRWAIATITVIVVLMASSFLWLVLGQMEQQTMDEAQARLRLTTDHVHDELSTHLNERARRLQLLATAIEDLPDAQSRLPVRLMLQSLQGLAHQESVYVGWRNGDLSLVEVAVTGVLQTREGPRHADYRLSEVIQGTGGRGTNIMHFYAKGGRLIERTERPLNYRATEQPWYRGAMAGVGVEVSQPFVIPGRDELGISLAVALADGRGVIGSTISLRSLNAVLQDTFSTTNSARLILDARNNVLAMQTNGEFAAAFDARHLRVLLPADQLAAGALRAAALSAPADGTAVLQLEGRSYLVASQLLEPLAGVHYRVLELAPLSDFTGWLAHSRRQVWWISAGMLVLLLPLAWLTTRRVSQSLRRLAGNAQRIEQRDYATAPDRVRSPLAEIDALGRAQEAGIKAHVEHTQALQQARQQLDELIQFGMQLTREPDPQRLFERVLSLACRIGEAPVGLIRIRSDHDVLQIVARQGLQPADDIDIPMRDAASGEPSHASLSAKAAWTGQTLVVDDLEAETRHDLSAWKAMNRQGRSAHRALLVVPLMGNDGQALGILALRKPGAVDGGAPQPFARDQLPFIEALASQAAVAIENQRLIRGQRDLTDAMIRILASAIDAKSRYTGGHCERVPKLAFMLADEASRSDSGSLAEFGFRNADEWREFQVGAWLHDCGKVTTPEHVMDKATKLELIYNRIHEVRMRFEVLLRDARIAMLKAVASGQPEAEAQQQLQEREQQLQQDFAFVAQCNLGAEFLDPAHQARLHSIAEQGWLRHFDDRLGLSWGELERYVAEPVQALPARERLLADKTHHRVPRVESELLDAHLGIRMEVPELAYHHGELYNLGISRGTLTAEERFTVNGHIIQTIRMLEDLPFPPNLRRVAEYAGTHHETMAGTGYPRRLDASQLSVPARIMAIADIFEALTAPDRPYKKAKSLSEAVHILHGFKKSRHIDGELFDLFLRSGTHLRYAQEFLAPEQIDAVDVSPYLG